MRSRVVTIEFNAVTTFAEPQGTQEDANAIASLIASRLRNHGWSVINASAYAVSLAFYHVTININLYENYDAQDTAFRYLVDALNPDFAISTIIVTDSGFPQTQTPIQQTPIQTTVQTPNNSVMNITLQPIGNGIYKDVSNNDCYSLEGNTYVYYGDCSNSVSNDWLSSIGNSLGFNSSHGLGSLGVSAAAGGALALLVIALLFVKK